MEFTEQEVREKLRELGYRDVPRSQLLQFMADLDELIQLDSSHGTSFVNEEDTCVFEDDTTLEDIGNSQEIGNYKKKPLQDITAKVQPKAFAKEKINQPLHHISFDQENLSLLGYSGCSESLSFSTYTESPVDQKQETRCSKKQKLKNSYTKRKVARKRDGSMHVFDESSIGEESELSDITALEDRIRNLPVVDHHKSVSDTDSSSISSSFSYNQRRRAKSSVSGSSLPAFIRPATIHPHTKKIKKCDPVSRYHQFKEQWSHNKFPGESTHSSVRWNVREQMLQCEVFEKPQHNYSANNYVVPTDKKRLALRWQVRTALARI